VLVHDGTQSRYFVLTSRGQYSVVKPWPKSGSVGFVVSGFDKPRHYAWYVKNGTMGSQSNQVVPAIVTADKLVPLDDTAWKIVERVAAAKLPRLLVQLKEHRDYDAKKHLAFLDAEWLDRAL